MSFHFSETVKETGTAQCCLMLYAGTGLGVESLPLQTTGCDLRPVTVVNTRNVPCPPAAHKFI